MFKYVCVSSYKSAKNVYTRPWVLAIHDFLTNKEPFSVQEALTACLLTKQKCSTDYELPVFNIYIGRLLYGIFRVNASNYYAWVNCSNTM